MDDDIIELLSELSRQFRTELRHASEVGGRQPTPFQNEILAYIGRNPGLGVLALADLSGRDKAQVTRILAELEALDLVTRERSTLDRRSTKLKLTGAGEEIFQQVLRKRRVLASSVLEQLTSEERAMLRNMLRKMRSGLSSAG
ncbi:MarR family winged helix-turn-helix transcriptional regulator [Rhizobium gallicum]|nr:MarR family transcriptional regulator [Rhizobium gallicum]